MPDRAPHNKLRQLIIKAVQLWRREGFRGILRVGVNIITPWAPYSFWVGLYDSISDNDREHIHLQCHNLGHHPSISVLMAINNTSERQLRDSIDSVRSQYYPHWELCISASNSTDRSIHAVLKEFARMDSRIKVSLCDKNCQAFTSVNSALDMAQGEFIAQLGHDGLLSPHALYMIAVILNDKPDLDFIYSDEDKFDKAGRRFSPCFKPDWNPDLLVGRNYVGHLSVYRASVVRSAGGFRENYEGLPDWDLALRVCALIPALHIHHIPHVLYHAFSVQAPTELEVDTAKAEMATVKDHLARTGCTAAVCISEKNTVWVRYAVPHPAPLVSIIIPTRNGLALLRRCIDSICHLTHYGQTEILIVDNQTDDLDTLTYLNNIEAEGTAKILRYDKPFNFSAINNFAVNASRGSYLCLMNNDVEVISEDWLEEMLSHAARPDIGVVGAMLYYPNNTIQHAGVILNGIAADHLHVNIPRGSVGYCGRASLVQNISAVTAACFLVRKSLWHEVGGMNEISLPIAFNDVDFCLRVRELGYRNLWTPYAELFHHESVSRGLDDTPEKRDRFMGEIAYLQKRWGDLLSNDPAWNPNLAMDVSWPRPAFPPRIEKPWKQYRTDH